MPRLLIVIASVRPGRVGLPVGDWFSARSRDHGAFQVEVIDLAEVGLPLMDEPNHPRLRHYTKDHTFAWSATVDAADALAFVTPEYNYGYPASLKNAIDYLNHEWRHKPLGFVSYGGVSAGTRSVQQLKQVMSAFGVLFAQAAVSIPFVAQFLDDRGALRPNEVMEQAANDLLDELVALHAVMAPLRADRAAT